MSLNRYVVKSLELHLFFGRIMKEHAFFLLAGFTPADPSFSEKAKFYLHEFETVLSDAVELADGVVGKEVLSSGEIVTDFTSQAERQTERFTCIEINKEITGRTLCLNPRDSKYCHSAQMHNKVRSLNQRALKCLDSLIDFKETILKCVLNGEMFTLNYPLLIEHILREAKLYRKYVAILERDGYIREYTMKETECFWNQIMMEHAQFIRGLLDPCEKELYCAADDFAGDYCRLLEASRNTHNKTLTGDSLEKTLQFRDFKAAGTQGIQQCKIRSVILPLLADHVLREANHYIRLLESGKNQ